MKLSEHWTLEELIFSDYAVRNGIDNTPPDWVIENLRQLCIHVLEPVRVLVGRPIISFSGYRCDKLNTAIGGSPDSQHKFGEAADTICPGLSIEEYFQLIAKNIPFDQLIQEGTWVHSSYRLPCRGQMLQATFIDGKPKYTPRFVDKT